MHRFLATICARKGAGIYSCVAPCGGGRFRANLSDEPWRAIEVCLRKCSCALRRWISLAQLRCTNKELPTVGECEHISSSTSRSGSARGVEVNVNCGLTEEESSYLGLITVIKFQTSWHILY